MLSAGTAMITMAPAATTAAAGQTSFTGTPPVPSSRASSTPSAAPTVEETSASGTASAVVSRSSCQRVAPRAASIADSPSRWPVSSRATASSAAAASRKISTAQMASSERATSTLLAVPLSTEGRLVATVRSGRSWLFCTDC